MYKKYFGHIHFPLPSLSLTPLLTAYYLLTNPSSFIMRVGFFFIIIFSYLHKNSSFFPDYINHLTFNELDAYTAQYKKSNKIKR